MISEKTTSQQEKVTGYVGVNIYTNKDQAKDTTVISFSVKPDNADWVRVRAFNETAKWLHHSIKDLGIKKLTLHGKYAEITYPSKTDENKMTFANELRINAAALHKPMEINGIIAKVEHNKTVHDKDYVKLFIIKDNDIGGTTEKLKYNAILFEETLKKLPADVKLEVGSPIAIKGEAAITRFRNNEKKVEEAIQVTTWNAARTPARLQEQIQELQKTKAAKEQEKNTSPAAVKEEAKSAKEAPTKVPIAKKSEEINLQEDSGMNR